MTNKRSVTSCIDSQKISRGTEVIPVNTCLSNKISILSPTVSVTLHKQTKLQKNFSTQLQPTLSVVAHHNRK